jgi:hypothetical protein
MMTTVTIISSDNVAVRDVGGGGVAVTDNSQVNTVSQTLKFSFFKKKALKVSR